MKAKELMLEDWVLYGKRYAIVKHIGYSRCDILVRVTPNHDDIVIETYDNIDPIPLTIEILEKNGFVKLGEQCDIWIGRGFNFALDLVDGVFGYHEQGHPYSPTFITRYVHELQHALRLFGLNDRADNFKI